MMLAGGEQANMIRVVDDILVDFPDDREDVGVATLKLLHTAYHGDITEEWDPDSYVGYGWVEHDDGCITLLMTSHVEHAVRQLLPGLALRGERPSASMQKGRSLQSLADGLRLLPEGQESPHTQRVQRTTGVLRFPEKVLPHLTLGMHRLSCVQHRAPPEAVLVADLLLEVAWDNRFEGLTYGNVGSSPRLEARAFCNVDMEGEPPLEPESFADSTWGAQMPDDSPEVPPLQTLAGSDEPDVSLTSRDLYSVVVTYNGAAIFHQTKSVGLVCDSSQATEEVASSKAAEIDEYALEVIRGLGFGDASPMLVGTDNKANMLVSTRRGTPNRSRHLLRRYYTLMQRIQSRRLNVVHVPDSENPSDFLTKWVVARKLRQSLAYVTGAARRPAGAVRSALAKRREGRGVR